MAVDNLIKQLNQNAGMSPQLIFKNVPIIEMMFNTSMSSMVGDTVRFDNLEAPYIDSIDVETSKGPCEGATQHCVGATNIVLQLTREYNDQYKIDNCELSKLDEIGMSTMSEQMTRFKGRTDRAYALAKARLALRKDILTKLTPITSPGGANAWIELNSAIGLVEKDNEYISTQNYVAVISRSYYRAHTELKGECCDFLTGAVPDSTYAPAHDLGAIVVVPDSWLKDADGNFYDYAIYLKAFALFWFRCMQNEFFEYTNEDRGYAGYHMKGKWQTSYDNHDPEYVCSMGVMANSDFTTDPVEPTVSIDATVNVTTGTIVDSAYLVANANLTSTLNDPVYTFFADGVEVAEPLPTDTAGSVIYTVLARCGSHTTPQVTFTLVVA